MNLKDWQAMSTEEQEAYIERVGFWKPTHEEIQEYRATNRTSDRCCSIRDSLTKQLKDEEQGVIFYAQIAGELGLISEDGLADVLNDISDNEFKHYLELRGIIDVLTEQCNCSRETIGTPFG